MAEATLATLESTSGEQPAANNGTPAATPAADNGTPRKRRKDDPKKKLLPESVIFDDEQSLRDAMKTFDAAVAADEAAKKSTTRYYGYCVSYNKDEKNVDGDRVYTLAANSKEAIVNVCKHLGFDAVNVDGGRSGGFKPSPENMVTNFNKLTEDQRESFLQLLANSDGAKDLLAKLQEATSTSNSGDTKKGSSKKK